MWVLAQVAEGANAGALVLTNAALKRIDHPFAGHHLAVTIARGIEQLAGSDEAPLLNAAEDELTIELAAAGGVLVARITERRRRRIHYAVRDPTAAMEIARNWAGQHRPLRPDVSVREDAGWTFRREFAG